MFANPSIKEIPYWELHIRIANSSLIMVHNAKHMFLTILTMFLGCTMVTQDSVQDESVSRRVKTNFSSVNGFSKTKNSTVDPTLLEHWLRQFAIWSNLNPNITEAVIPAEMPPLEITRYGNAFLFLEHT